MKNAKTFHCAIEGCMTSALTEELREAILPAIMGAEEIVIDLSQVSAIDYSGAMLMAEARQEASACGKALHFIGHSRPVLEFLERHGMNGSFGASVLPGITLH
jgi:anti-anti-sigma regulatory factor